MILVSDRSWRVAVSAADEWSSFTVAPVGRPIRAQLPASGASLRAGRCTIEVLWRISGMMPHGLLVASFSPAAEDELTVEVVAGGAFDLSGPPKPGPLAGPSLVAGLPPEFRTAVIDGVTSAAPSVAVPRGRIQVTGGGIDVDSSVKTFQLCGRLLLALAAAKASGSDPDEAIRHMLADSG